MSEKLEKFNQKMKKRKEAALGRAGGKAPDPSGQGADSEGTDAPALYQRGGTGKLFAPPGACDG